MQTKRSTVFNGLVLAALLAGLFVPRAVYAASVRYASPAGLTSGACGSWAAACGLTYAISQASAGDEIWVAAGTYKPTSGIDRTISFSLKEGVAVYGGFAGTETLRSQRSWAVHLTTLSGEIGAAGTADNSYNVVTGVGLTAGSVLDGFTLTAGNADGANPMDRGGGMNLDSGSPTLANLTISANSATYSGGMHLLSSSPTLTNVTFSANSAFGTGGMSVVASSPTLTNVTFTANSSSQPGGAMYLSDSSPTLTNVTFNANSANIGGGMYLMSSSPTLTNVTFNANSAGTGGGMYLDQLGIPTLTNVTFSANSASTEGGGIYNVNSSPSVRNSIFWGNTAPINPQIRVSAGSPSVTYSLVQGGYAGTGNLSADPLFVNAAAGDLRLQSSSPAINAGDPNSSGLTAADLDGRKRVWDSRVDMGAYENHVRSYVRSGASGAGDGSSWADAFAELRDAVASARPGDSEIWVVAGTYQPTPGTNRTISFTLPANLALYGGFAGTETLRSQRNWAANQTILSGEIGAPGAADNSYHVVTGSGLTSASLLDGFTITAGSASGSFPGDGGGGMRLSGGSPTLANLSFSANSATYGGGIYLDGSSPTLTNVTFSANSATIGGGIFDYVSSNAILTNVIFNANSATTNGGGIYIDSSSPTLTNVSFSANSAASGGGIYSLGSSPSVRNSILWGNTAANGAQIFIPFGTPSIVNSLVQGGFAGTGNIDGDPLFVNAAAGNLRPRPASPAVDAGNSAVSSPALPASDLDGSPRVAGGSVDLGAYEVQSPNHAPVLSALVGWNLPENPLSNPGMTVAALLAGQVSDADGTAASAGIAVFALDNSHGKWQTSPDGSAWTDLPAVSSSAAVVLGQAVHLRFVPDPSWLGSAALSLRAWDGADGRSSGDTAVDLAFNGANSAFSASPRDLTVIVGPVRVFLPLIRR